MIFNTGENQVSLLKISKDIIKNIFIKAFKKDFMQKLQHSNNL